MMTAILILVFVALFFAFVGVCCQIAGGGFFAIFHLLNNSIGQILEWMIAVAGGILEGLNN